jgi:hypothetical protein
VGAFDAVVEHTCFCALHPSQWPDYVVTVAELLRPGGTLFGAFLHFDGGGPPFGTTPAELRAMFGARFTVVELTAVEPFAPKGCPQLSTILRRRP